MLPYWREVKGSAVFCEAVEFPEDYTSCLLLSIYLCLSWTLTQKLLVTESTQRLKNIFSHQASNKLSASHSRKQRQHTYLYKPTKYSGRTVLAPADLIRRGSGKAMLLLVSSSTSSPMGLTTVHISNRSLPMS